MGVRWCDKGKELVDRRIFPSGVTKRDEGVKESDDRGPKESDGGSRGKTLVRKFTVTTINS